MKAKKKPLRYPADVITAEQRAVYDETRRSVRARNTVKDRTYPVYVVTDAQKAYYDQYDLRYSVRGTDLTFFDPIPGETENERQARLQGYPGVLPGEAEPQRQIRLANAEKEAYDTRPLEPKELIWLRKNVII